jgi:hypothetical protein
MTMDEKEISMRNVDCKKHSECLAHAAKKNKGFKCVNCKDMSNYLKPEKLEATKTEEINIINIYKVEILTVLSRHIGKERAIGMAELHEEAFGEPWENRINDTRKLRKIVTLLRKDGVAICSDSSNQGGGYYLASAGSELEHYLGNLRRRALTVLFMESKIRRIGLPELLGQMQMNLTT